MFLHIEEMFNYPSIILLVSVVWWQRNNWVHGAQETYTQASTGMDIRWVRHFELYPSSTRASENYLNKFSLKVKLIATDTSRRQDMQKKKISVAISEHGNACYNFKITWEEDANLKLYRRHLRYTALSIKMKCDQYTL